MIPMPVQKIDAFDKHEITRVIEKKVLSGEIMGVKHNVIK